MFFKRNTGSIDWLVAGLGNPGKKYEHTRHNVGFDALDLAAGEWGIDIRRARFDALTGAGTVAGSKVLLVKPQTYMNLSGQSLLKATQYYKLPPERVLVLCDDIHLAPGALRIRLAGSDGGQNGLKSIITFLGQGFARIRIGVGDKPHPEYDMKDWVLSRFTSAERKLVEGRFADIAAAARLVMAGRAEEAMGLYNNFGKNGKAE